MSAGSVLNLLAILGLPASMAAQNSAPPSQPPPQFEVTQNVGAAQSQPPKPAEAQPPKPVEAQPPKPVEGQPPKPVEAQPPKPVEAQPPKPVEAQPPKPVEAQPPKPVEAQPYKPVEAQPLKPVEAQPPKPVEAQPPKPVEAQPPKPILAGAPESTDAVRSVEKSDSFGVPRPQGMKKPWYYRRDSGVSLSLTFLLGFASGWLAKAMLRTNPKDPNLPPPISEPPLPAVQRNPDRSDVVLRPQSIDAAPSLVPAEFTPILTSIGNQPDVPAVVASCVPAPTERVPSNSKGATLADSPLETKVETKSSQRVAPDPSGDPEQADKHLKRIRKEMPAIFQNAATRLKEGELGLIGLNQGKVILNAGEGHENAQWFIVGDLHGDFLAWHYLFERVRREANFRLCFLGDLVDRGPLDVETFAAVLAAVEEYPGKILWIAGNHDVAIRYREENKAFVSAVEPAEFVDWLNAPPKDWRKEEVDDWGKLFVGICAGLPRAVLLPGGLLAVHGGVPLEDRWADLSKPLNEWGERTLADFTWTRATQVPTKQGWKYDPERRKRSSAFEFGYRDLAGFKEAAKVVLPFTGLVRGHDHVANGHEQLKEYSELVPLLTINGFGFNHINNSVGAYRDSLALGIWKGEGLPEVEPVAYHRKDFSLMYTQAGVQSSSVES